MAIMAAAGLVVAAANSDGAPRAESEDITITEPRLGPAVSPIANNEDLGDS